MLVLRTTSISALAASSVYRGRRLYQCAKLKDDALLIRAIRVVHQLIMDLVNVPLV